MTFRPAATRARTRRSPRSARGASSSRGPTLPDDVAYRLARALHRGETALAQRACRRRETTAANTVAAAHAPELIHPGVRATCARSVCSAARLRTTAAVAACRGPRSGAARGRRQPPRSRRPTPAGATPNAIPTLSPRISKPDGPGPFPAVVIVHDCSGLGPRSSGAPGRWARSWSAGLRGDHARQLLDARLSRRRVHRPSPGRATSVPVAARATPTPRWPSSQRCPMSTVGAWDSWAARTAAPPRSRR